MSILQHDGFDLKSLEQAFLAENNLVREKIFSHLIEIFGEEDVLKIFSVNFDSEEQFWNHIAKLYRKTVGPIAGTPSVGYPPRSPAATKIANFVGKVTKRMRPRLYPGIRINRFLEKERSG